MVSTRIGTVNNINPENRSFQYFSKLFNQSSVQHEYLLALKGRNILAMGEAHRKFG
jgi:hypothetical protein